MESDEKTAVILYAHGARDPRWAVPFERLRARVSALAPGRVVVLAFLEHQHPSLPSAFQQVREQGIQRVRVVPLFFGRGGHLRADVPKQLEEAQAASPGLEFEMTEAAGENDGVLQALAQFALEAPARRYARRDG